MQAIKIKVLEKLAGSNEKIFESTSLLENLTWWVSTSFPKEFKSFQGFALEYIALSQGKLSWSVHNLPYKTKAQTNFKINLSSFEKLNWDWKQHLFPCTKSIIICYKWNWKCVLKTVIKWTILLHTTGTFCYTFRLKYQMKISYIK